MIGGVLLNSADSVHPFSISAELKPEHVCELEGRVAVLGANVSLSENSHLGAEVSVAFSEGSPSLETSFGALLEVKGILGFAGPWVEKVAHTADPMSSLPSFHVNLLFTYNSSGVVVEATPYACVGKMLSEFAESILSRTDSQLMVKVRPVTNLLKTKVPMTTLLVGKEATVAELVGTLAKKYGGVYEGVATTLDTVQEIGDILNKIAHLPNDNECGVQIPLGRYRSENWGPWQKLSSNSSGRLRFPRDMSQHDVDDYNSTWNKVTVFFFVVSLAILF